MISAAESLIPSISPRNRQARIVASLVGVLATAGKFDQAESLVRSITSPVWNAQARLALAKAAPGNSRTVAQAEASIRDVPIPLQKVRLLGELSKVIARSGDLDRAMTILASVRSPDAREEMILELARAAVGFPDVTKIRSLAAQRYRLRWHEEGLVEIVKIICDLGDLRRAEEVSRSITRPTFKASALMQVAKAVSRNDLPNASKLADEAERIARSLPNLEERNRMRVKLLRAVAMAGDLGRAEAIAESISDPDRRAQAMMELAKAVAMAGDLGRAEAIAESISDPDRRAQAMMELAKAVAMAGDLGRAEAIAESISDPDRRAQAMMELAKAVAMAGDLGRAEAIAESISNPDRRAQAMAFVLRLMASRGSLDLAESRARTFHSGDEKVLSLAALAAGAASAGHRVRANTLLREAEALAKSPGGPHQQDRAAAAVARATGEIGAFDHAEDLANIIVNPDSRAWTLISLASSARGAGDSGRTDNLIFRALEAARSFTNTDRQALLLIGITRAADPSKTRNLIALAAINMSWPALLGAVALVQPAALSVISDDFMAKDDSGSRPLGGEAQVEA